MYSGLSTSYQIRSLQQFIASISLEYRYDPMDGCFFIDRLLALFWVH
ncbi:hypothetical protein QUA82_17295 [Microcoleus sp. F8-D3]